MDLALAVAIGLGFALFFGAGVAINHGYEAHRQRKHVCNIITADDHRDEGARLLHQVLHFGGKDPENRYERYLRDEAFHHFQMADIIDNGPYKS